MTLTHHRILTLCGRLQNVYSGIISDVLQQDLKLSNFAVCPFDSLHVEHAVCGPVFTTMGEEEGDNVTDSERKELDRIRIDMLQHFPQGAVQVLQPSSDKNIAFYGDLTASTILQAGGIGAIVDGPTRDLALLRKMGFPMLYMGTSPVDSIGSWNLTDFNCEIAIEDTAIFPDDIVHMSEDGALFFSRDLIEDVWKLSTERMQKEERVRHKLMTTPAVDIYDEEGRW